MTAPFRVIQSMWSWMLLERLRLALLKYPVELISRTRRSGSINERLFVEERYWDEYQMLQQYKQIHPHIDWADVPIRMRYKTWQEEHPVKTPAPPDWLELPTFENAEIVMASEETERVGSSSTSRRATTRSSSSSTVSLIPVLSLLLLGPDLGDDDNDGLPNWWEYKFFTNSMSSATALNDYSGSGPVD